MSHCPRLPNSVREVASSKLEEQLRDLQARHTRLTQRFHDLQQGGGTAARVATLESEREALMDYLQVLYGFHSGCFRTVAATLLRSHPHVLFCVLSSDLCEGSFSCVWCTLSGAQG